MLVTSTWWALSLPPKSCIPPEPVWQGPVQVPRKRHPGWAFLVMPCFTPVLSQQGVKRIFWSLVPPQRCWAPAKSPVVPSANGATPGSHLPAGILQKVGKGKKEEAETSEKRPNLISKPPQALGFREPLMATPAPLSVQPVGPGAERTSGSTPWLPAPAWGQELSKASGLFLSSIGTATGTQPRPTTLTPL